MKQPYKDFLHVYFLTLITAVNEGQRPGQWLSNSLEMSRPDIADAIRATDADPFYQDARIVNALNKIEELW